MNKLKNTKKSAAFDRSSLIINLFREFPNNKFSLKHLASASGGATKEGRLRTREIITELLAQGTIEECVQTVQERLLIGHAQEHLTEQ